MSCVRIFFRTGLATLSASFSFHRQNKSLRQDQFSFISMIERFVLRRQVWNDIEIFLFLEQILNDRLKSFLSRCCRLMLGNRETYAVAPNFSKLYFSVSRRLCTMCFVQRFLRNWIPTEFQLKWRKEAHLKLFSKFLT